MVLQKLLECARQGDTAARNALLGSLRPFVRAVLRRAGCADADASDFANEALLKINHAFPGFRGESSGQLKNWCRRVAVNLWIDDDRKPRLPLVPLGDNIVDVHGWPPEGPLLDDEVTVLLTAALQRLKPHRRKVLELRFFGGLKCADVALQMGQTKEWVRITSLRACRNLKRIYRRQQ